MCSPSISELPLSTKMSLFLPSQVKLLLRYLAMAQTFVMIYSTWLLPQFHEVTITKPFHKEVKVRELSYLKLKQLVNTRVNYFVC